MTRAHSVIRACAFSLAAVAWLAAAAVSQAAIIAYDSGINYWTTAPTDVTQGERNMSGKLLAFDEQQDVTLASLLNVDHYDDAHPYNVTLSENNTGNSGSVAAGTLVDSHFVYYDRSNSGNTTGSITFDSPIVGLAYGGTNLDAGDSILGLDGTTYPTGETRAFILASQDKDKAIISKDGRTLTLTMKVGANGVDQLRVLTSPLTPVTSPTSFAQGVLESNKVAGIYEEKTLTLPSDLTVDQIVTGAVTLNPDDKGTAGVLAAGTPVRSYLLHADGTKDNGWAVWTYHFDNDIVGLLFRDDKGTSFRRLNDTDSLLGLDGTTFATNNAQRGAIWNEITDNLSVSADQRTLTVKFRVTSDSGLDEIRVLTEVPGNDSTLYFGATPDPLNVATSTTGATVDFGKVLEYSVLAGLVTLNKIGDDDASYTITASGDAATGTGDGTITGGTGSLSIDVTIDANPSGLRSGTITIHNTSADSQGPGRGSQDGDDTITVLADVYQFGYVTSNQHVLLGDGDLATVTSEAAFAGGQRISMFVDPDPSELTVTGDGWSAEGLIPGVTETGVATTSPVSFSGTARFASADKLNGEYSGELTMRVVMDPSVLGAGAGTLTYAPIFSWNLLETVSDVSGDQSSVFTAGTDLGDLSIARHGISDAGGGTIATLLDGTLTSESTVSIGSWTTEPSGAFGGAFVSDAFSLTGTGSETIVLQVSYNPALLGGNEAAMALAGEIYLGWFDGLEWVNAVAGNTGGTPNLILGAYDPGSHSALSNYGVDTGANTVWAVINHNSEFAALGGTPVPEPATLSLVLIGALGVLARRRRRG